MKIVMVGHEGVGKTTYMTSMYREMATHGLYDFWVRAQTEADHRKLLRLADGVTKSRYPPPSERRSAYDLTLRYGANALLEFQWSDYRGGALRDADSSQAAELIEDSASADAVLLFLESGSLVHQRAAGKSRIRDLTNIAFKVIAERETLIPIVVVITKSDMHPLDEEPIQPLRPFIEAVNADQRVRGIIAPIVCGPQPENILLPVMFSLYFGLITRAEVMQARVEMLRHMVQVANGEINVVNNIRAWWKGEKKPIEIRNELLAHAYAEHIALEQMKGPAQMLGQMLTNAELAVF
jgi:GTPase SAR1 family protein